ncbi:hypothetical protein [Rubrivivax albus]|uniref:Uncharacterized protein n=1 Tax=Rubrivivax albus TaxID=2499835 RepID=A0A437JSD8_9BURK|nr:hypothetical protein [Rubrivivax albus]RVT49779.1 hypothetical protein ENE75_19265 [Rubrivivax albus]
MSDAVKLVFVTVSGENVVRCTPDPAAVSGSNVLINFRLVTDGWVFPDSGAVVVSQPGSSFPYASWTLAPQSAALLDTVESKGDYSYTVTVMHQASGRRLSIDPTIRNQD